jgi:hypothetical protein
MSLPLGGVFDVKAGSDPGYAWTPPHKSHRLGKNLDMKFPALGSKRGFLERAYRTRGIYVFHEDQYHWHLY